jgi:putative N6-adenine-specific DNA methylase
LNKESTLLKRIKRHVTGPVHAFFASTPPGFEDLCKYELMRLPIDKDGIKVLEGGVEFRGKLIDCYLANLYLRTANRVLFRIAEFNASNFRKLEKHLMEIPWELYIKAESKPSVSVTTRHSRIYHSDAISERVIEIINSRKKAIPFVTDENNNPENQDIYIRSVDDCMTISLDSSGDNLYKRGVKLHTGKAPIRETIAAAALFKAGYTGEEIVFDPMCGTGTFSIEAAMLSRCIPPGWYREFAFMSWPGFRPAQWAHIKKQAEKDIRPTNDILSILACDKDPEMCEALSKTLVEYGLDSSIRVINNDFFEIIPSDIYRYTGSDRPGLIIINPPYGIRLGTRKGGIELSSLILKQLEQHYKGWKFALFSPERRGFERTKLKGDKTIIDHGGLKLVLFTGVV